MRIAHMRRITLLENAMSETFLEIAVPNCTAEELDGELVAINLDTGIYFSIKDDGALLWNDLADGHSVQSLTALVSDNEALAAGLVDFANQLVENGLMRQVESRLPPASPARIAAVASTLSMPELESFGDMQSLLLLDPVHEVDGDAGWPRINKD